MVITCDAVWCREELNLSEEKRMHAEAERTAACKDTDSMEAIVEESQGDSTATRCQLSVVWWVKVN